MTPFQRLHAANHALICGSDDARSSNVPPLADAPPTRFASA
ncbi:hypothetical protein [Xanthomonas campestris]|nr:hypothetical protein [Xanthomonas campestris]